MHKVLEHVEQLVVGYIKFGNARIYAKRSDKGYVAHLCTVDEEGRFVDLALTRQHLEQIRDGAADVLERLHQKGMNK